MQQEFPSAKVICHSRAPNGEELITLELEFHRFILSQLNTHRMLSKNVQSSRAIPISKMIEQVRHSPAMPLHWGKNQKGMVAEKECNNFVYIHSVGGQYEGDYENESAWQVAAKVAAQIAESFEYAGYSKEIVNRLLEPWMKTKGIFTGTRRAWEAFFKLRCHPDAQAEIRVLAERIRDGISGSVPDNLQYGDYHLPYIPFWIKEADFRGEVYEQLFHPIGSNLDFYTTDEAIKISCSCAAQVSYRRLDDSLDKALKVYDMLNLPIDGRYPDDPPHYSPTEHIAKIMCEEEMIDAGLSPAEVGGNFNSRTFWQYRKALEMGIEKQFLEE